MRTLTSLIAEHNVTVERISNARNRNHGWPGSQDHRMRLRMYGQHLDTDFFTGSGWTTIPTVTDVMSCMVSDTSGLLAAENMADWMSEYGVDDDAAGRALYRRVERQTARLQTFLGTYFDAFVWSDNNV